MKPRTSQNVDIAGGELRSGTGGRDPLSCRLCRTTRTMSEYRSLGQSADLLSLPARPDTPRFVLGNKKSATRSGGHLQGGAC